MTRRQGRSVKDHWRLFRRALLRRAMVSLGTPLTQTASATWRLAACDLAPETQALFTSGQPMIFAMWHGRMFGMLLLPVARKDICVLISGSNDGQAIADVAHQLGFGGVIRRASYKNSAGAMRHLLAQIQQGFHAVITVDGPRGPAYQVKPGVLWLSQKAQVPIIPVSASCAWPALKFPRAWDGFHAPSYWSPVRLALGAPIWPSPQPLAHAINADHDTVLDDDRTESVRHALMALTQHVDRPHVWCNYPADSVVSC